MNLRYSVNSERLPLQMVTGQDRVFVAPSVPEPLSHRQRKAPQIRDTAQRC